LNVYGILAKSSSATTVDVSVIPSDSWNEVARFSTQANFDAFSAGFGTTATIGVVMAYWT
jgi:hypothetical protein